ncbi:hypothetical protein [Massilia sp. MS-15]|uniref:hypothetical protein n=1 Tax=Massilia sp. MS-15 TaxID=2878200 RepID=UPI001CD2C7BB|nr:hypothetical protein [Massilia sp. MS-15]MCA1247357.1 hypothetical protein [Massilia sp. MS-15]
MTSATLRVSVFLVIAANLASCVPKPHVVHLRPAVSGILVEDGKPIPGVELFLGNFAGNNQPCTDVYEVVPVSPAGDFSWKSTQDYKLADSLINPVTSRRVLTVLCIRHPKKGILIGVTMMTKQEKPVSLRLICDVAHPRFGITKPHTTGAVDGQAQHCDASTTG